MRVMGAGSEPEPTGYEVVRTGSTWAQEVDPNTPSRRAKRVVRELDRKRLI